MSLSPDTQPHAGGLVPPFGPRHVPAVPGPHMLRAMPALWGIVLAGRIRAEGPSRARAMPERAARLCPTMVPRRNLGLLLPRPDQVTAPARTLLVSDASGARGRAWASPAAAARVRLLLDGRGTGPAVLWAVSWVRRRDPEAIVALLPEDRLLHVTPWLVACVARAAEVARRRPEVVVVLAAEPDGPGAQRGWILPGEPLPDAPDCYRVGGLWDRPSEARARIFFDSGFLLDSGIVVARASAIHALGRRCLPDVSACVDRLGGGAGAGRDRAAPWGESGETRPVDFMADALARDLGSLVVLSAPRVASGLDRRGQGSDRARVEPGWLAA